MTEDFLIEIPRLSSKFRLCVLLSSPRPRYDALERYALLPSCSNIVSLGFYIAAPMSKQRDKPADTYRLT